MACSVIQVYLICTDCWLITALYFTWLAFDWNTPKKGKRVPHPRALGALPPRSRELKFLKFLVAWHLLCEKKLWDEPGCGFGWGRKVPQRPLS